MPEPIVPREVELTYSEAAVVGFRLHTSGRLEESETIYRQLLEIDPGDCNVIHFLGVLMHQTGRRAEALEMIERSLALDDRVAAWHNNYGNVLLDANRLDEAEVAYQRCIALDAGNIEVRCNLGALYRCRKRFDEAEVLLKSAVTARPDFIDAYLNMATLYWEMGRFDDAYAQTAAALRLYPLDTNIRARLAHVFGLMGRLDDAADVYREWLALEPENEMARHHLAGCTGVDVPERARDAYVEGVFDKFASTFDAKLAHLEYRAPQLVGDAVARLLPPPRKEQRVLDAGCGTGLCSPYLAPYARVLTGVDLSARMLDLARARGLYTELVKGELVEYLAATTDPFDLIVTADTLCYFGRLDHVARAARHALCEQGLFIFTVEALEHEPDYRLQTHGRYSHRVTYVRSVLERAAFVVRELTDVVLRTEGGRPVAGVLAVAQAGG